MKKRLWCFLLCLAMMLSATTACSRNQENDLPQDITPVDPGPTPGEIFVATPFKIKCIITPQKTATLDPLTFEVYVDGDGSGTGLMGYKDLVYDVVISNNKVYVKMAENVVVYLSELSGHFVPSDLDFMKEKDLTTLGFTISESRVATYKASTPDFLIDTTYGTSDSLFEATTVAGGNSMTITELVKYILDLDSTSYTAPEEKPDEIIPEKGSFWNSSQLGVKIHDDTTYSIGDFCNPSSYFEGQTPETIISSYAYNMDKKVEFHHINYQSSDGRTSFVTTEGYVQALSTTSYFEFLGMKRGDANADVRKKLGIGLKKDELETWTPLVEGLTVIKGSGSGSSSTSAITLSYDELTIQLIFGGKNKTLSAIKITNYIDFLNEG